jgi:hypothetical protein
VFEIALLGFASFEAAVLGNVLFRPLVVGVATFGWFGVATFEIADPPRRVRSCRPVLAPLPCACCLTAEFCLVIEVAVF